jgi:hypothetical protein
VGRDRSADISSHARELARLTENWHPDDFYASHKAALSELRKLRAVLDELLDDAAEPATRPRRCRCGCGRKVTSPRAVYASGACRVRAWRDRHPSTE